MPPPLPPILYHIFRTPLPYGRTLALQERLHALQLARRRSDSPSESTKSTAGGSHGAHADYLLLLQHRPVYTAGRRQDPSEQSMMDEQRRLTRLGADFVPTQRGGELTYHGPGQLVGYPLLDLGRTSPPTPTRSYVCLLQTLLKTYLAERHAVEAVPSEHTGVFVGEGGKRKVASIGCQVRHRLTSHGFAMNVTDEPLPWFDTIVACGLADVRAASIRQASNKAVELSVKDAAEEVARLFGRVFGREMIEMSDFEDEDGQAILELEEHALRAGDWPERPAHPMP